MSKLSKNSDYKRWVSELKLRIQQSQIKVSIKVNSSLIELYWSIGADIVAKQAEMVWGNGIIKKISNDLRNEFPNIQGFSETNIKYMKRFYLFYNQENLISHQVGDQLKNKSNLHQVGGKMQALALIPWRHHVEIISKCKNTKEAFFYIQKTIEENWSRAILDRNLKSNLHKKQGRAVNNFKNTLPAPQSELANEILKDPYNLDFITVTDDYKEKELENALIGNITKFLLELGKGFSFVGKQVEIAVNKKPYFIDMLFYHIKLKCYVVIELKTVAFEPEFAGKLNFYVTAVDRQIRGKDDNQTIGILICKTKDKVVAEYALADIHKPLGVSSYDFEKILPKKFKSALPSIEEIERELSVT
jgi:predicted nuclease of restriction endonuclease-like (RecB) superfamily